MNITLILYTAVAVLLAQGAFLAIAPARGAAFQMWQYRFMGARPAEAGNGTVLAYRIGGIVMVFIALFTFTRIP